MTTVPNPEQELLARVKKGRETGEAVEATLKTNARVFARITDGIYREPASALRELIANAYDADATNVRIDTDAPRFSRITVRDNGSGLSEEGLVHVICNIGGSLKRTSTGKVFHVTNENDATQSPNGRKLIGKLGIGLFSVSQLTHHLVIVTKIQGEAVRRVCDILLMPQNEEIATETEDEKEFVTGTAEITTIPADDIDSQGTEITLLDIRPYVQNDLRSMALWSAIDQEKQRSDALERVRNGEKLDGDDELIEELENDDEFRAVPKAPLFHIGQVDANDSEHLIQPARLPWLASDSPDDRFSKLIRNVKDIPVKRSEDKIKVSEVLDKYLQMIWTISLCVPLPYIQRHPFSISSADNIPVFTISNKSGGRAEALILENNKTIAQTLDLQASDEQAGDFSVFIDGIKLFRPIEFPQVQLDDDDPPLLFIGKLSSELAAIPSKYRGGPIEFEAYLYWTKRVVPVEHNGVMIRVNGASGILFDEHFLKYKVSEQTRLRQITAEIFIRRGVDAAQNIDRESFNIAHPHYQILANWLHHALRQLNTRHKALGKGRKDVNLHERREEASSEINSILSAFHITENKASNAQQIKPVLFVEKFTGDNNSIPENQILFERSKIFAARASFRPATTTEKLRESLFEEKIKAVAQVLNDFGLLGGLDGDARECLLSAIVQIFSVEIRK